MLHEIKNLVKGFHCTVIFILRHAMSLPSDINEYSKGTFQKSENGHYYEILLMI